MGTVAWWKNLSVSKKLYAVVGIMAFLIATELFTLLFAMRTLSAVRGLVGGEGLWSKAQKNAVHNLEKYAVTHNQDFYLSFQENIKVQMGDRQARLEMEKPDMNFDIVFDGFIKGNIHPEDIPPIVNLLRRFYSNPFIVKAVGAWRRADVLIDDLMAHAEEIHRRIQSKKTQDVSDILDKIYILNNKLTVIEDEFSSTLGEASRWLERLLMIVLVLAVITVESTGLFLTIAFSRRLNKNLKELNEGAQAVGRGDFSQKIPVHSNDELGQLARQLNSMIDNLQSQISERRLAEHASQTKNLFLANMSHEIRTPLNAILGFTDILKDSHLPEAERHKYLDIIKRTGTNLATIINDILDISKVEAEQLKIEKVTFSFFQLLADLESVLRLRCEEKGIFLKFISEGKISEYISSDPGRLRQVLLNVIGNAIKFTDRGGVTVNYWATQSSLFFEVHDTGTGIPPEQQERLFHPFSQGDTSINKKYGGTGLGLVLAQRLARLLGGDVGLKETIPGRGSIFYAKVAYEPKASPLHAALPLTAVNIKTEDSSLLKNKKILIVEDTQDNQLLLKVYLEKYGSLVEFANDGAEGVNKALATTYDLILMDMQMPIKDGFEATAELRQKGVVTPIIALTGFAMKEDRDRCLQAGCNDYLSKPIERSKLIAKLVEHLS